MSVVQERAAVVPDKLADIDDECTASSKSASISESESKSLQQFVVSFFVIVTSKTKYLLKNRNRLLAFRTNIHSSSHTCFRILFVRLVNSIPKNMRCTCSRWQHFARFDLIIFLPHVFHYFRWNNSGTHTHICDDHPTRRKRSIFTSSKRASNQCGKMQRTAKAANGFFDSKKVYRHAFGKIYYWQ